MPPKGKQSTLEKKLDEYLGLCNPLTKQEKIQKARGILMRAVYQRIDTCGDELSAEEVKALKEATSKFVQRRNETLARRVIRALDKERWDVLRIELVTFSRVRNEHMKKMRIEFRPLHPYQLILEKVDRLDPMYRLGIAPPSQSLLDEFINLYYPLRARMCPSEMVAKHRMIGYFDLLDSFFPSGENCWVLLNELPLANLSSTSQPSEVKATIKGFTPTSIERSTFLTGRAGMAIVSLAGKDEPIMQDQNVREQLVMNTRGSLTYKNLFNRMNYLKNMSGDGNLPRVESLQLLVMEAKMREHAGRNAGGVGTVDGEEDEFEGGSERPPEDSDDDFDEEASTEGEDSDRGQGEEEGEGRGREERKEGDLNEDEKENDTSDGDQTGSGGENQEDPLESALLLKEFLPQIVGECVALRSGSFPDRIIKFTLSDGDNWIFGLVDCVKGKGGWICHQMVMSVNPEDSRENKTKLEADILGAVNLLALWVIVPGVQLKRLFPKKQEAG